MSHIPYKPSREDDHSSHHAEIHERLFQGLGLLRAGAGILIEWDGNQYVITGTARNNAASTLKVLKYDSTKAWSKGAALAKVRVDDDAVVTGITIGGVVYKATPGKWIATQSVPTPPTLPAHIPSFDTRADNDPENTANFWEFVTPATVCLPGQDSVEV